jgi:hypothetical protein
LLEKNIPIDIIPRECDSLGGFEPVGRTTGEAGVIYCIRDG